MSRVEYNRDALALIRKGASAADLGWDEPFYERVRREHGLPRGFGLPNLKEPEPAPRPSEPPPQQKRKRRRRPIDFRRQSTVACPHWMIAELRQASIVMGKPISDLMRSALLRGDHHELRNDWRRGGGTSDNMTVTLGESEEREVARFASSHRLTFPEFARRAVASWLDKRRPNLAAKPEANPDIKAGLS